MRKTSRRTYLIALVLFLVGLGCLAASGLRAGRAYFVTVSEALTLTGSAPAAMKLLGVVTGADAPGPGTPDREFSFNLADVRHPELTIAVRFSGRLPPLFNSGAELVARGMYDPARRLLAAEELIAKCPARYEKQNREVAP